MKKILKYAIIVFLAANILSILPFVLFLARPEAGPYPRNEELANHFHNNTGDRFMFIVLGDSHNGFFMCDSATLRIISWMNHEDRFSWKNEKGVRQFKCPIDFVIHTGDVAFRGSEPSFKRYAKLRGLIKWPVFTAVGNHDKDVSEGGGFFDKYCGKAEFSFADRNSYFIFLDNAESDLDAAAFRRLKEMLEKGKGFEHIFIVMHKSPIDPIQHSWYRQETNPWHREFMKLCEDYKVKMVLSGHVHLFSGHNLKGVEYLTSGASGMPLEIAERDGGFLHYVVVKVNGPYVTYEVRRVAPPLWELTLYYMWKEPIYWLRGIFWCW